VGFCYCRKSVRKEAKGGEVGFPNATQRESSHRIPHKSRVGPHGYGTDAVDSLHVICQKGLVGSAERTMWYIGAILQPVHLTLQGVFNTSRECPLAAVIVMLRTEVTASRVHNNERPILPIKASFILHARPRQASRRRGIGSEKEERELKILHRFQERLASSERVGNHQIRYHCSCSTAQAKATESKRPWSIIHSKERTQGQSVGRRIEASRL
jgi:hypothetical protein